MWEIWLVAKTLFTPWMPQIQSAHVGALSVHMTSGGGGRVKTCLKKSLEQLTMMGTILGEPSVWACLVAAAARDKQEDLSKDRPNLCGLSVCASYCCVCVGGRTAQLALFAACFRWPWV